MTWFVAIETVNVREKRVKTACESNDDEHYDIDTQVAPIKKITEQNSQASLPLFFFGNQKKPCEYMRLQLT
jgi:hypothetical protein